MRDENSEMMSSPATTNGTNGVEGDGGEDGSTSPTSPGGSRINYDRDFLINIGNQLKTVFPVPEEFKEIAKEANETSPTRSLDPSMPARGVIPVQRSNSRGGGLGGFGGGLGGMSFGNGRSPMRPQQQMGGPGWAFGPMCIPPPPPTSRPPPKVIEIAPKQDIKLHEAEKPWKPGRRRGAAPAAVAGADEPKSEEQIMLEALVKETRSILNKLIPENFDRLKAKFMELKLENKEDRVGAVINVLFEKAIDEPAFSASYAKMVHAMCSASDITSKIFRKQLLDKCQKEFQKSSSDEDLIRDATKTCEEEEDPVKKEQLRVELEDLKFNIDTTHEHSIGNNSWGSRGR